MTIHKYEYILTYKYVQVSSWVYRLNCPRAGLSLETRSEDSLFIQIRKVRVCL